jgi:cytochrome c
VSVSSFQVMAASSSMTCNRTDEAVSGPALQAAINGMVEMGFEREQVSVHLYCQHCHDRSGTDPTPR